MKLLIVVDKLLTGFDAPSATYLYIDKQMRDHGLFQAICRVNRLDGDDKEYGYIIDYKDLFKSLERSIHDYTSGALDGYDQDDVAGLLRTAWRRPGNDWKTPARPSRRCASRWSHRGTRRPISATSAPETRPTRMRSRTTSRDAWRSTSSLPR